MVRNFSGLYLLFSFYPWEKAIQTYIFCSNEEVGNQMKQKNIFDDLNKTKNIWSMVYTKLFLRCKKQEKEINFLSTLS